LNWDAIGAVGELVGAAAVVVTVGYLALQIRNETTRARTEARRARSNRVSTAYADLADSTHVPDLLVKLGSDAKIEAGWKRIARKTSLEPVEAVRYSFSRQGILHGFQDTLLDEALDPSEREAALARLRYTILQDGPAFLALWEALGPTFTEDFQHVLNLELENMTDA
jgi:hypothetical protein